MPRQSMAKSGARQSMVQSPRRESTPESRERQSMSRESKRSGGRESESGNCMKAYREDLSQSMKKNEANILKEEEARRRESGQNRRLVNHLTTNGGPKKQNERRGYHAHSPEEDGGKKRSTPQHGTPRAGSPTEFPETPTTTTTTTTTTSAPIGTNTVAQMEARRHSMMPVKKTPLATRRRSMDNMEIDNLQPQLPQDMMMDYDKNRRQSSAIYRTFTQRYSETMLTHEQGESSGSSSSSSEHRDDADAESDNENAHKKSDAASSKLSIVSDSSREIMTRTKPTKTTDRIFISYGRRGTFVASEMAGLKRSRSPSSDDRDDDGDDEHVRTGSSREGFSPSDSYTPYLGEIRLINEEKETFAMKLRRATQTLEFQNIRESRMKQAREELEEKKRERLKLFQPPRLSKIKIIKEETPAPKRHVSLVIRKKLDFLDVLAEQQKKSKDEIMRVNRRAIIRRALRKSSLFGMIFHNASRTFQEDLLTLFADSGETRNTDKDVSIRVEDDIYLLVDGTVEITRRASGTSSSSPQLVKAINFIEEHAAVTGIPCDAQIWTVTQTNMTRLRQSQITEFLAQHPAEERIFYDTRFTCTTLKQLTGTALEKCGITFLIHLSSCGRRIELGEDETLWKEAEEAIGAAFVLRGVIASMTIATTTPHMLHKKTANNRSLLKEGELIGLHQAIGVSLHNYETAVARSENTSIYLISFRAVSRLLAQPMFWEEKRFIHEMASQIMRYSKTINSTNMTIQEAPLFQELELSPGFMTYIRQETVAEGLGPTLYAPLEQITVEGEECHWCTFISYGEALQERDNATLVAGSLWGLCKVFALEVTEEFSSSAISYCWVERISTTAMFKGLDLYGADAKKFKKLVEKLCKVVNLNVMALALKEVELFNNWGLEVLEMLARRVKGIAFAKGENITREGARADIGYLYAIKRGSVDVIIENKVISTLFEGSAIGEATMLGISDRYGATTSVTSFTICLAFRQEDLIPVFEVYKDARLALEHVYVERMSQHVDKSGASATIPFLKNTPFRFTYLLDLYSTYEFYYSGEVILKAESSSSRIFLINLGICTVLSGGQETGTLKPGDVAGEMVFFGVQKASRREVVAKTCVVLQVLPDKEKFVEIMSEFPEQQRIFSPENIGHLATLLWDQKDPLANLAFFKECSLEFVGFLSQYLEAQFYVKDQIIIEQGSMGTFALIFMEGSAVMNVNKKKIGDVEPESIICEDTLLRLSEQRQFEVKSLSNASGYILERNLFQEALDRFPEHRPIFQKKSMEMVVDSFIKVFVDSPNSLFHNCEMEMLNDLLATATPQSYRMNDTIMTVETGRGPISKTYFIVNGSVELRSKDTRLDVIDAGTLFGEDPFKDKKSYKDLVFSAFAFSESAVALTIPVQDVRRALSGYPEYAERLALASVIRDQNAMFFLSKLKMARKKKRESKGEITRHLNKIMIGEDARLKLEDMKYFDDDPGQRELWSILMQDCDLADSLCSKLSMHHYNPRELIWNEEKPPLGLMIVRDGVLECFVKTPQGKELVGYIKPGAVYGEVWCVSTKKIKGLYSIYAPAANAASCFFLPKRYLNRILESFSSPPVLKIRAQVGNFIPARVTNYSQLCNPHGALEKLHPIVTKLIASFSSFCPYDPGDVVCERGSHVEALFIIDEGELHLTEAMNKEPFARLGPGTSFGALNMLGKEFLHPWTAFIPSRQKKCTMIRIVHKRDFFGCMRYFPQFRRDTKKWIDEWEKEQCRVYEKMKEDMRAFRLNPCPHSKAVVDNGRRRPKPKETPEEKSEKEIKRNLEREAKINASLSPRSKDKHRMDVLEKGLDSILQAIMPKDFPTPDRRSPTRNDHIEIPCKDVRTGPHRQKRSRSSSLKRQKNVTVLRDEDVLEAAKVLMGEGSLKKKKKSVAFDDEQPSRETHKAGKRPLVDDERKLKDPRVTAVELKIEDKLESEAEVGIEVKREVKDKLESEGQPEIEVKREVKDKLESEGELEIEVKREVEDERECGGQPEIEVKREVEDERESGGELEIGDEVLDVRDADQDKEESPTGDAQLGEEFAVDATSAGLEEPITLATIVHEQAHRPPVLEVICTSSSSSVKDQCASPPSSLTSAVLERDEAGDDEKRAADDSAVGLEEPTTLPPTFLEETYRQPPVLMILQTPSSSSAPDESSATDEESSGPITHRTARSLQSGDLRCTMSLRGDDSKHGDEDEVFDARDDESEKKSATSEALVDAEVEALPQKPPSPLSSLRGAEPTERDGADADGDQERIANDTAMGIKESKTLPIPIDEEADSQSSVSVRLSTPSSSSAPDDERGPDDEESGGLITHRTARSLQGGDLRCPVSLESGDGRKHGDEDGVFDARDHESEKKSATSDAPQVRAEVHGSRAASSSSPSLTSIDQMEIHYGGKEDNNDNDDNDDEGKRVMYDDVLDMMFDEHLTLSLGDARDDDIDEEMSLDTYTHKNKGGDPMVARDDEQKTDNRSLDVRDDDDDDGEEKSLV